MSADDFFERLSAVLLPLCEAEDGTARSRTGVIGRRLEEYVLTHYSDPQICLESLAGAFGLNPQYVSRLFKAEVGEQFSKYLEALRLNQAETRLSETSTGLEEIAFSVGYQSMNSFYKAFRRYHGMSPAKFRRNISVPV